ncbi:hypothetical protein QTV49_005070 [Vibrio vulnificus]|nr:hypothetical protein [Vibrio vulnificus]
MITSYDYNAEQRNQLLQLEVDINSGYQPIVVINPEIFEECFLEPNMRARLVNMELNEKSETKGQEDLIYRFTLDFSEFYTFNKPLAQANYFDKTGNPCLTAEEAGLKPDNNKEVIYHSITHGKVFFDLALDCSTKVYEHYLSGINEHGFTSYVAYLENMASTHPELQSSITTIKDNDEIDSEDSDHMNPDDAMVIFKLSDMKHPIAGRYRKFEKEGRFTKPDYVYIHRGDGQILQKYKHGFTILSEIEI